jgi:hypothetical protein
MTPSDYAVEVALEHVMWLREAGWTPAHIASLVGVKYAPRTADNFLGYDDAVYALARAWNGLVGVRGDVHGIREIDGL